MGAKTHHIVIVGAGFAGVYALRTLQRFARPEDSIEITLINREDSFVFVPMLHEVATGLLRPDSITMPLRFFGGKYVRNIIQGDVTRIDYDRAMLTVERADSTRHEIAYDSLIIATGSQTSFMGVPGAAEYSLPLRTLADAKRIKNRIIDAFDAADELEAGDERDRLLRFVVVGGGATGVETAAELGECLCNEIPKLFPRLHDKGEVVLIDRGERLLAEGDPWFSTKAEAALTARPCTRILHETMVDAVSSDGVETNHGPIRSATVLWCAGVEAATPSVSATTVPNVDARTKRVHVNPDLSLESYPNVFVVGDAAAAIDATTNKPYAMRAQFAVRQGTCAAHNVLARVRGKGTEPFSFREQGFIVSLGGSQGIAKLGRFRFSGRVAWVIYHVAYIRSLIGMRAKLRTLLDWTLNLFGKRDMGRV